MMRHQGNGCGGKMAFPEPDHQTPRAGTMVPGDVFSTPAGTDWRAAGV